MKGINVGESLSLKPDWSNHGKKKDIKDIIEQEDHVPVPTNSKTWKLYPHGSGLRVKAWLRKVSEVRHMLGVSLNGSLERSFCKTPLDVLLGKHIPVTIYTYSHSGDSTILSELLKYKRREIMSLTCVFLQYLWFEITAIVNFLANN